MTFDNNQTTVWSGGAVANYGSSGGTSSPTFTDVSLSLNTAQDSGGAVYNYADGGIVSPTFNRVSFTGNEATWDGGAVLNIVQDNGSDQGVSSPTFANVTFYGNGQSSSLVDGGALMNHSRLGGDMNPVLSNVTFSGNAAEKAGAMYGWLSGLGSLTPVLTNVIMWEDTAGTGPEIFNDGGTPSFSYSDIQGSGGSGSWDSSLGTDGGNNLDSNPLLAPLANNGGFTQTMALVTGSAAIDHGNNTVCAAAPVSNHDQREATRPVDGNFDATATCDIGAYEYQGHLFADVPVASKEWMEPWIEMFYYNGITTGCGVSPLIYCPENAVTRAAMAVFVLRAEHGAGYVPPTATHTFTDMPVAGKEWMEPWVDQLYAEGITSGCGPGPTFCPENPVTRAAMAVFLLRALEGSSYVPPPASHFFSDMPVAGKEWMEPFVDEFYSRGITTGCGAAPLIYCPENPVTRAAMAVFIDRGIRLVSVGTIEPKINAPRARLLARHLGLCRRPRPHADDQQAVGLSLGDPGGHDDRRGLRFRLRGAGGSMLIRQS